MSQATGTTLRLVGPLIEVACIAALFRVRGSGLVVLGVPAEWLLYVGIAVGFVLVIVGIALSRPGARPRDRWDAPRDAGSPFSAPTPRDEQR